MKLHKTAHAGAERLVRNICKRLQHDAPDFLRFIFKVFKSLKRETQDKAKKIIYIYIYIYI